MQVTHKIKNVKYTTAKNEDKTACPAVKRAVLKRKC